MKSKSIVAVVWCVAAAVHAQAVHGLVPGERIQPNGLRVPTVVQDIGRRLELASSSFRRENGDIARGDELEVALGCERIMDPDQLVSCLVSQLCRADGITMCAGDQLQPEFEVVRTTHGPLPNELVVVLHQRLGQYRVGFKPNIAFHIRAGHLVGLFGTLHDVRSVRLPGHFSPSPDTSFIDAETSQLVETRIEGTESEPVMKAYSATGEDQGLIAAVSHAYPASGQVPQFRWPLAPNCPLDANGFETRCSTTLSPSQTTSFLQSRPYSYRCNLVAGICFDTRFYLQLSVLANSRPIIEKDNVEFSVAAPSGSTNPFGGLTAGTPDFPYVHTYGAMNDLADFMLDGMSFLSGGTQFPLRVNVQVQDPGRTGVYVPRSLGALNKLVIHHDPGISQLGAFNMSLLAHEYGHYIHDTFGYAGRASILEGFASTMPLRWIIYQTFRTMAFSQPLANYFMSADLDGSIPGFKHDDEVVNGEHTVKRLFGNEMELYFYPSPISCIQNEEHEEGRYYCAAVMSMVYWELAWDRCRLSYGSCLAGADIVQSGTYASQAYALANSAFSYAISVAQPGWTVGDFMFVANGRYWDFVQLGYLSSSDYQRVTDVFAHHCTGVVGSQCLTDHKLPGSFLPSVRTVKELFQEAEAPSPAFTVSSANDTSASAGRNAVLGTGQPSTYSYSVTTSGNYRVKVLAKIDAGGSSTRSLEFWNGVSWQNLQMTGLATTFKWYTSIGTVPLTAGTRSLSLRPAGGSQPVRLDVVLLERVP